MQKLGYREDKKNLVALEPTNGFNFEKLTEKVDFILRAAVVCLIVIHYLQESRLIDRTKAMWTPKRRCAPEHSKQEKAPIFKEPGGAPGGGTINDAHRGDRSEQSEQT